MCMQLWPEPPINPSVLRTGYACALLADKDSAKAAAYLARFEDVVKRYPYAGEIEGERELINTEKLFSREGYGRPIVVPPNQ